MGRCNRLRTEIAVYLGDVGDANTLEILDHLNARFRWGATMNQIGNVLARDRRFSKAGYIEELAESGFRQRLCVWSLVAN